MIRFGMWQEILDMALPEEPDLFKYTTCAMHQAVPWRWPISAGTTRSRRAEAAFVARAALPDDWMVFNNTAATCWRSARR
jgi:hypothetical protein